VVATALVRLDVIVDIVPRSDIDEWRSGDLSWVGSGMLIALDFNFQVTSTVGFDIP
jgi:hypothetical protein